MRDKMFIVPHSHYDAAVFKTREETQEIGHSNILDVLNLMKTDETYKFVLDQVACIKPFLERYPEQEDFFTKMLEKKQLEIAGGMYVMPDVNIPNGESLVQQILSGKKYCRQVLGLDVKCGWMIDSFGHHPQMPQIMKKSGFDYYVFWRGVKAGPSEFFWEGIDGTEIICHWMPRGYSTFWQVPQELHQFNIFAKETYNFLKPYAVTTNILALSGGDLTPPSTYLSELTKEFNDSESRFELVLSTPSEFFGRVENEGNLPVVRGDFNPIYPGCYSARIEVKQQNRLLENLLFAAEELVAFSWLLEFEVHEKNMLRAWEPVLFNQFHDVICGCHTDKVFENTMGRYKYSKALVEEEIQESTRYLADRIDTRGKGIPLIVFNQLAWERTDVVECDISFTGPQIFGLRLENSSNYEIPLQIVEEKRYDNNGLKKVKIIFVAERIPSMGYEVYHLIPNQKTSVKTQVRSERKKISDRDVGIIENKFYTLEFDLQNGVITSIRDKRNDWEIVNRENRVGNTLIKEPDHGDFWQYNDTVLNGGVTPVEKNFPFPKAGGADFSHNYKGDGQINHGQVMAEFSIEHSFGLGKSNTRVRIYHNVPRIDITTILINNDERVRYRVAFPTTIKKGRIFYEIPFGAIERPQGEFPAQNWIDYSDRKKGVALLNRGLPGNNVTDGIIMLSVLKCTKFVEYPETGGYEKGIPADGGFEKGREHCFSYALFPHSGDWEKAHLYQRGLDFNNPLIVKKAEVHVGKLPLKKSFLGISASNVITSAVKKSNRDIIVRVYEAGGRKITEVKLWLDWDIESAFETNLIGEDKSEIRVKNRCIYFDIGPFEIKTFKIKLVRQKG